MNKVEIRKALRELTPPYKCKFRANPFNPDRTTLTLVSPDGLEIPISSATVLSKDTYERHKKALEICNKFEGSAEGGEK